MSYETGQPIFKDYILKSPIGEGGFGRVYLVESPNGIRFALKVLHRGVEMEQRGVESVKGISSDYLVRVLDYGETVAGQPCILMEYYKDNLRSVVDAGKVDEERACRCFEHILKGLMVLERHGVMHRDIKPENLFIREGNIKIGDFGTARYTAGDTSHKSHVIGTIQYMAPERFSDQYGHAVDRWAAAAVFYRLLTGKYPFKGKDRTQIFAAILRDEPGLDLVPEKYHGFFGKCFSKDEKYRYQSPQEMLADFKRAGKLESGKKKKFGSFSVVLLISILLSIGVYSLWLASRGGGEHGSLAQTEQKKYSLSVFPVPHDAEVRFLNIDKQYSPDIPLPPGRYKIEVSKEGFRSKIKEVVIADSKREIWVNLTKLKYPLTIETTPDDAKVQIGNTDQDYKPFMMLEPGKYLVGVTRDGYKPHTEWVEIKSEAIVRSVQLKPEKNAYSLIIDSKPDEATVKIMNISSKYHPGIKLEPGRYDILVEYRGYKPFREWIEVTHQDVNLHVDLEKRWMYTYTIDNKSASVELRVRPITTDDKDDFVLREVENKYVDNGDGTVTDRTTGLIWEKMGSQRYITYEKAKEYVYELKKQKFAGHANWRLPTMDELWSLIEKEKQSSGFFIDSIFKTPSSEWYWCWSSDKTSSEANWVVHFDYREANWYDLLNNGSYARCVQSEKLTENIKLRSEAITTEDKDDFALKEVENGHVDNGDGTITDHTTGLMWEKSGSQNYMTFEEVRVYVNTLNQNKFAGYNDWRLPTVDELWSIVEKERRLNGLFLDPMFEAPSVWYWCWSSDTLSSESVWGVRFATRYVGSSILTSGGYVKCVRQVRY